MGRHGARRIGYSSEERGLFTQKWSTCNVELKFSNSAEHAQQLIDTYNYEWAIFHSRILDCLPYINTMRKIKSTPILVLTPENNGISQDIVQCLRAANDDTIQKTEQPLHTVSYGDLYFCKEQHIVRVRDHLIKFTAKEFDLFSLLISNPNRVFTYEMIMDIVWNGDRGQADRVRGMYLPHGTQGGRAQRVPDARLDLSAECLKCPE